MTGWLREIRRIVILLGVDPRHIETVFIIPPAHHDDVSAVILHGVLHSLQQACRINIRFYERNVSTWRNGVDPFHVKRLFGLIDSGRIAWLGRQIICGQRPHHALVRTHAVL